MTFHDSIKLRPRFQLDSKLSKDDLLNRFKVVDPNKIGVYTSVVDPHIFLRIPKKDQHFWSPQLHLEVFDNDMSCRIRGLFGPNPKLWTFFMFLHFLVAGVFIGCSVWAYVNWTLNQSFIVPIVIMFLMIIIWFVLYFLGRIGKQKGKDQMKLLYNFTISKV